MTNTTIDDVQIIGHPNYYGVLVDEAHADVTNSQINDVGEPQPNGAQHGVAVAYFSGVAGNATGTVANNDIERYQKGGVLVKDAGSDVTTDNNIVQGLGPVPYIAQNGIQYSDGAAGKIFTNTVTDNYYTGCSNQDSAKTGCTPYVSTGILLYNINPPDINTYNNFYRDDQRNLYMVPSASLK